MGVQEIVGVPQDLQIDPAEGRIGLGTRPLDSGSEAFHTRQILEPFRMRKIGEPGDTELIGEQKAIAG